MYKYACLNNISIKGLKHFTEDFTREEDINKTDCIVVRSADMNDMELPSSLKCIARAGVGVNNIPLDKCSEAGIVVFNTPGANSNAVKESVLAGLLMASRDLLGGIEWVKSNANDTNIKKDAESEKKQFAGSELAGKSIGVIGLGAIGIKVANTAIALGMDVYGYDAYLSVSSAWELDHRVHRIDNVNDLYPQCDFITIHVPFVPTTEHMIDENAINQIKDHAVLLNYARDKLCDEDAVIKALDSGKLSYYMSDFPNPTVAGHDKCIVTPHLGASTKESVENCAVMGIESIIAFMCEGNIFHSVNYPPINVGHCIYPGRIVILHQNIPNMVGQFTKILGSEGTNIENMGNKSKDQNACTVIDTSESLNEKIIDEIAAVKGVHKVRKIK